QPELGQEVADGVEDDVVTASRAPPDLLVAGEVLGLLRLVCGGHPPQLPKRGDAQGPSGLGCHSFTPPPIRTVAAANRANLALSISLSLSVPSSAPSMMPSTSSARNAIPSTLVTD